MAPNRYYASSAFPSVLNAAITTTGATTLSIPGTPAALNWPSVFPYTLLLDWGSQVPQGSPGSAEVVSVTNASGSGPTTLTIIRGVDGTTAATHAVSALPTVYHGVSAQDYADMQNHLGSTAGVHGITGNVVGTTDVQTLTNKTLVSPALTGTPFAPTATALTGSTQVATTAYVDPTSFEIGPADVGVIGWTGAPTRQSGTVIYTSGIYTGRLLLFTIKVPVAGTITNINYSIDVIGAGMSNAYLGLYSMPVAGTGSLLAQCTTDQSTNLVSVNAHAAALSTPYAVAAGLYRIGFVLGAATTAPTFMGHSGTGNLAAFANLGLSAANSMSSVYGSLNTYTALPSTYTTAGSSTLAGYACFVLN